MAETTEPKVKKFAGIVVQPGLSKTNYFFMFFNTFIIGMFMSIPAIVRTPAMPRASRR